MLIEELEGVELTDAHIARLTKASGIAPEVIRARGYRSAAVADAEYYKENHWDNLAKALPGLEIPLWGVNGKSSKIQLRPDAPPSVKGPDGKIRTQKYLYPAGEVMSIDVNPLIAERVRGIEPLWITEGILKADSAISHGLVCIALLGVWNWRGLNESGGSTALGDWDEIALSGRDVYIVFDSDLKTNRGVQTALGRLASFLTHRGARVSATLLPEASDGTKVGLDDWFVAGHTVPDLMACARKDFFEDEEDLGIFTEQAPVIYGADSVLWRQITKNNEPVGERQNLGTFYAQVDQQITLDDGVAPPSVSFRVSGRTLAGAPLQSTEIGSLTEVVSTLIDGKNPVWSRPGVAINNSIRSVEKEVANCLRVQMEQRGVEEINKFTHSGWREIDGVPVYLTTAGAITPEGIDPAIIVDLEEAQLEINVREIGEASDVRHSLDIIKAGDGRVLGTLLAGVYAAPLREVLDVGFSLHLYGHTGTFKTEISRIMASHFGRVVAQRVGHGLGSWTSTQNAITKMASAAKDALYVIDDLVPDSMNSYELRAKTDTVFRAAGNASGRARMNRDSTMRMTYVPRCLILSTGEDLPPGESVIARLVAVEVDEGWLSSAELLQMQQHAERGVYERAMGAYLKWLAQNYTNLKSLVAEMISVETKLGAIGAGGHARLVYNNRALLIGAGMFLLFAQSTGVITTEEAREYMDLFRTALAKNSLSSEESVESASTVNRVSDVISSTIARQEAHFASIKSDGFEPGLEALGWSLVGDDYRPHGPRLGFFDKAKDVVLIQVGVLVTELAKNRVTMTKKQLLKELVSAGFVDTKYVEGAKESNTHNVYINKTQQRVTAIKLSKLMPYLAFAADTSAAGPEF